MRRHDPTLPRGSRMPEISNINHISLTVTDVDRSAAWYADVLGFGELMREDHPDDDGYAIVLGKPDWSVIVGLHTHPTNDKGQFAETTTGLDHVSFGVANRAELKAWQDHLDAKGVSQSPINDRGAYAVLVFRDLDDIQLEFIAMGTD
jgi:catechol 2,3-dioxygenase-like lactoylglutathione lyase family enzyme